jgi:fatty-acid peroxygenase
VPHIPRDTFLDATLALKRDPYGFISARCRRLGSDWFQTRLLLRDTVCMTGREAGVLFYDPSRFARGGAAPVALQRTLFGRGGVQGLDGDAHTHRKQLFLSFTGPAEAARLVEAAADQWRRLLPRWGSQERVVLYDALHELLTRAVCDWAGIRLADSEAQARARDLAAMFDRAGSVSPGHFQARRARRRSEAWATATVARLRLAAPSAVNSPARRVARHRGPDGKLLDARTAAVELLNLLRPTVAVSVFIVFAAHALELEPYHREALQNGDETYAECMVDEIRRFYPFFPAIPALTREDFEWQGCELRGGTRVLFDLYGTNHDERIWKEPERFRPERFLEQAHGPFEMVPQGSGSPLGHRCPGELIAIELTKLGLDFLARRMEYEVPPQDLRIDRTRLPALPRSRFVIRAVQAAEA